MAKEQLPASSLKQEGAVLGTLGACAWPLLALPAIGCWVVSVKSLATVLRLEGQMSAGKSA